VYSQSAELDLAEFGMQNGDRLVLQAEVRNLDLDEHVKLAIQTTSDGKILYWDEIPVSWYTMTGSNWWTLSGEFSLFDYPPEGEIKIFLYSPAERNVWMKDLRVAILRNAG
jgi:hypothetical protein